MMPTDYAGHLTDAQRAEHDRDNATGIRLIIRVTLVSWTIFALLLALIFVLAGAASSAAADPNVETILPADGVTSIERVGDEWTVTMIAPPSEVKIMTPNLGPVCGTNYADTLGLCATTTATFTASAPCVYVQVDGIPGENSSDPYVCRTTPTTTPDPEETSWPTAPPEPESTSTPQPTSNPVPTSVATPADVTPSPSSTANAPQQPSLAVSAPRTLADTGSTSPVPVALVAFLVILVGVVVGSRAGARMFRLSDDSE